MDKALLSGSTAMLLLKLLEEQDMYGYQMIETLARRSDHTLDLKARPTWRERAVPGPGGITASLPPVGGGWWKRNRSGGSM